MQIKYDVIDKIINNLLIANKNKDFVKYSDSIFTSSNPDFMNEYNIIKDEIIEETKKRQMSQVSGIQNKKNKDNWKFDVDTIIDMIKDKGVLSFNEISKKYKDINGNPIKTSDVQNICSNGRSYWLDESDFIGRYDMTYIEYKNKRESNVRHETPKNCNNPNTDYSHRDMVNSISKRTCDSATMVEIFKDKYSALTAAKSALKYENKNNERISECLVKQIWSGSTKLFESDFADRTDITFEQYLEDVKKDKKHFAYDLQYEEKLKQLLIGIDNHTIKDLTRTHISIAKHCGKDAKFINELRIKIKNQKIVKN